MKKIMMFLAVVVMILAINGCAIGRYDNNYKTMDDITRHFLNSGLRVDTIQPLMPFFNAKEGRSLLIDGTEIGIYKYEVSSSSVTAEKAKKRLDDIYNKGYVYIEGLKYPVLLNGTFMLIGYEKNPSRNKIIEVFQSFE